MCMIFLYTVDRCSVYTHTDIYIYIYIFINKYINKYIYIYIERDFF